MTDPRALTGFSFSRSKSDETGRNVWMSGRPLLRPATRSRESGVIGGWLRPFAGLEVRSVIVPDTYNI